MHWASDLFMIDNINSDGMSLLRSVTSILLACYLWLSSLAHSEEVSCHTVRGSLERPTWQGMEADFQPTTTKELKSSIQQSTKNWILQVATRVILEANPSQWSFGITAASVKALSAICERLWAKDPAEPPLDSRPMETEIINIVLSHEIWGRVVT